MGLQMYACKPSLEASARRKVGYGPLQADPNKLLRLPRGFSYQIISRQGTAMSDGLLVPGKPDGMAAFPGPNGRTIIVRNHELDVEMGDLSPFGSQLERLNKLSRKDLYDPGHGILPGLGGTSTLIYNTHSQKLEAEWLSLAGTIRNCAGGPTPWNSWITCEETVHRPKGGLEKFHGFNFEVPATATQSLAEPVPIKAMGRFQHEAVAVDPRTSIVYQTEDRMDGIITRYIPTQPSKLHKGGKLQALMIVDEPGRDTRNWPQFTAPVFKLNRPVTVQWIDLDGTDSLHDDLRYPGFEAGAARFARAEGMWFGNNEVFFACTNGGRKNAGQIFRYVPSPFEGTSRETEEPSTLELFLEPNNTTLLENCDNLTQAANGDLIVCEDNFHPRILGITPKGNIYNLAENIGHKSEFAGVTFSPDGSTLFVNIQHAGLTLAITGPWRQPPTLEVPVVERT